MHWIQEWKRTVKSAEEHFPLLGDERSLVNIYRISIEDSLMLTSKIQFEKEREKTYLHNTLLKRLQNKILFRD